MYALRTYFFSENYAIKETYSHNSFKQNRRALFIMYQTIQLSFLLLPDIAFTRSPVQSMPSDRNVFACVQTSPISFVTVTKEIGDVCTQETSSPVVGISPISQLLILQHVSFSCKLLDKVYRCWSGKYKSCCRSTKCMSFQRHKFRSRGVLPYMGNRGT